MTASPLSRSGVAVGGGPDAVDDAAVAGVGELVVVPGRQLHRVRGGRGGRPELHVQDGGRVVEDRPAPDSPGRREQRHRGCRAGDVRESRGLWRYRTHSVTSSDDPPVTGPEVVPELAVEFSSGPGLEGLTVVRTRARRG